MNELRNMFGRAVKPVKPVANVIVALLTASVLKVGVDQFMPDETPTQHTIQDAEQRRIIQDAEQRRIAYERCREISDTYRGQLRRILNEECFDFVANGNTHVDRYHSDDAEQHFCRDSIDNSISQIINTYQDLNPNPTSEQKIDFAHNFNARTRPLVSLCRQYN